MPPSINPRVWWLLVTIATLLLFPGVARADPCIAVDGEDSTVVGPGDSLRAHPGAGLEFTAEGRDLGKFPLGERGRVCIGDFEGETATITAAPTPPAECEEVSIEVHASPRDPRYRLYTYAYTKEVPVANATISTGGSVYVTAPRDVKRIAVELRGANNVVIERELSSATSLFEVEIPDAMPDGAAEIRVRALGACLPFRMSAPFTVQQRLQVRAYVRWMGHLPSPRVTGRRSDGKQLEYTPLRFIDYPALRKRDELVLEMNKTVRASNVYLRAADGTVVEFKPQRADYRDCADGIRNDAASLTARWQQSGGETHCLHLRLSSKKQLYRTIAHGTEIDIEIDFKDTPKSLNVKGIKTTKRRPISLYGFESNKKLKIPALGFWVPVALFSSNFKVAEDGIPIAIQPVGAAYGFRWHLAPRFYIGFSGIASWTVHPEAGGPSDPKEYPGGATEIEPSPTQGGGMARFTGGEADVDRRQIVLSALTLGGLVDISNYISVGAGAILDFGRGDTKATGVMMLGISPDLLNALKGGAR